MPVRKQLALFLVGGGFLLAMSTGAAQAPRVYKIPVCPIAGDGKPMTNPPGVDFTVSQGDQVLRRTHYWGPESPLLIVLALDTTGDLTWINTLRTGLEAFVRHLPANIQVMVVTINDGIKVVQNNTADPDALARAVQQYDITGRPGFLENVVSLEEKSDRILERYPLRVATLYVTDSDLYGYRRRFSPSDFTTEVERIKSQLWKFSAPLYVLRLPLAEAQPGVLRGVTPLDPDSPIDAGVAERATAPPQDFTRQNPTAGSGAETNNIVKSQTRAQDLGDESRMRRTYEGAILEIARESGGDAAFPLSLSGVSSSLEALLQRIQATCLLGCDVRPLVAGQSYTLDVRIAGPESGQTASPGSPLRLEYKKRIQVPILK
jgi:hypothetical protein